ncbi:MAG: FtsX-like permease family protein [Candidatus Bathyarchaeia archaeon]|jgi:ABC-type antimicrobial peptide transport system permease subunit
MPLLYPFKRVTRNWKLFVALLIGIILASTFFAAVDIKANIVAKEALDQRLNLLVTDLEYRSYNSRFNLTNLDNVISNITSINGVEDVAFVFRSNQPFKMSSDDFNSSWYGPVVAFPNSSRIYKEWLNRPEGGIGENETYLISGQTFKGRTSVGDNISTAMAFWVPANYTFQNVPVNLTIAGYANITDKGYSLITGNTWGLISSDPLSSVDTYRYQQDMMIVSWENTVTKLLSNVTDGAIDSTFLINLDHDALINPWDTSTSAENVETVAETIRNTILANFEYQGYVSNILGNNLRIYENNFQGTLLNFLLISFPVFFVAWYLGSTVSDVSYNLRRREIGLLSTKGLSSGQIQRMFLTEALAIGFVGGVVGVVCGMILNQVFLGAFNLDTLFSSYYFSPITMVITVIFGMVLAFFSVFMSARKASRLPTVEALRDYIDADMEKPYRKKLTWAAFILGSYKIAVFASGTNLSFLLQQLNMSINNYYATLLIQGFAIFDLILTYIGPILFFWGLTKILIHNSLKFQQLTSSFSKVMGDLGSLAVKNVRRNPARIAAVAFLIAFIVGYSVQVSGQLSSEQDYIARQVQQAVGADISVSVLNATQTPKILESILANVSGIKNTTLECELTQTMSSDGGQTTIMHTIDPDSWAVAAYYEPQWFTGASMEQAFDSLRHDNMTIILERSVAQNLNLTIGDKVGINFPSGGRKLTIVGFFGPEPTEIYPNSPKVADQTWSFIPRNLFNMSSEYSDAYKLERFDERILIKLEDGVNGTLVAQQIRDLDLEILGVTSFDEQWQLSQQMGNINTYGSLQNLDVQRMGLVFAVLSASVGTTLVSLVSLRERNREATLMSVRGLSYRQLVWMFLSENIAVMTFAVLLGLGVGAIIVYGNVSTASIMPSLVTRHVAFSTEAIVSISSYIALIYASVIFSVLIMSRQYVSKLDKMVRLR